MPRRKQLLESDKSQSKQLPESDKPQSKQLLESDKPQSKQFSITLTVMNKNVYISIPQLSLIIVLFT